MNIFRKVVKPDETIVYTEVIYSKALNRNIRLVCLPAGKTHKLYVCTDTAPEATKILQYYQLRFQIEFLFRDSKKQIGLNHCQARNENKFRFLTNVVLTVNLAKIAHWLPIKQQQAFPWVT